MPYIIETRFYPRSMYGRVGGLGLLQWGGDVAAAAGGIACHVQGDAVEPAREVAVLAVAGAGSEQAQEHLLAQVVDALRLAQTAQSADLDVDDAAAPQIEGFARIVDRMDALVQTDRRAQLCLQPRVIDDVVVRQRLLDHHQLELIQRLQRLHMLRIVERVGGVGVRHQW